MGKDLRVRQIKTGAYSREDCRHWRGGDSLEEREREKEREERREESLRIPIGKGKKG